MSNDYGTAVKFGFPAGMGKLFDFGANRVCIVLGMGGSSCPE